MFGAVEVGNRGDGAHAQADRLTLVVGDLHGERQGFKVVSFAGYPGNIRKGVARDFRISQTRLAPLHEDHNGVGNIGVGRLHVRNQHEDRQTDDKKADGTEDDPEVAGLGAQMADDVAHVAFGVLC